jgi:hypothetical protein
MQRSSHSKSKSYYKWLFIAMAYILALPLLAIWAMVRAFKYFRTLRRAIATSIVCIGCKRPVLLVGMWRCECGFTYQGHLMRPCPICHRVPKVARCFHCGITTQLT